MLTVSSVSEDRLLEAQLYCPHCINVRNLDADTKNRAYGIIIKAAEEHVKAGIHTARDKYLLSLIPVKAGYKISQELLIAMLQISDYEAASNRLVKMTKSIDLTIIMQNYSKLAIYTDMIFKQFPELNCDEFKLFEEIGKNTIDWSVARDHPDLVPVRFFEFMPTKMVSFVLEYGKLYNKSLIEILSKKRYNTILQRILDDKDACKEVAKMSHLYNRKYKGILPYILYSINSKNGRKIADQIIANLISNEDDLLALLKLGMCFHTESDTKWKITLCIEKLPEFSLFIPRLEELGLEDTLAYEFITSEEEGISVDCTAEYYDLGQKIDPITLALSRWDEKRSKEAI